MRKKHMLQRPPHSCAIVVSWLRRHRLRQAVAIHVIVWIETLSRFYQVYLVQRARRANEYYSVIK
jgi:hypothetical protein